MVNFRPLMFGLALPLAMLGCSPAQPPAIGYTPEMRQNFFRACEAQQAQAEFCACAWDRIVVAFTPAEFVALEDAIAQKKPHPRLADINDILLECRRSSAQPNAAPAPAP